MRVRVQCAYLCVCVCARTRARNLQTHAQVHRYTDNSQIIHMTQGTVTWTIAGPNRGTRNKEIEKRRHRQGSRTCSPTAHDVSQAYLHLCLHLCLHLYLHKIHSCLHINLCMHTYALTHKPCAFSSHASLLKYLHVYTCIYASLYVHIHALTHIDLARAV